ncbi:MAG: NAD(+) diphosphatase [Succinivibrio sp.]|jgi:NAD+ diphosphatase|nr:NAD(+) diphosphatase [Succinivibrio sp.]
MIQDIGQKVFNNAFAKARDPLLNDEVFVFKDRDVLSSADGKTAKVSLPEASLFEKDKLQFLFLIDEKAYFLYTGDPLSVRVDGFSYYPVQIFRSDNDRVTCFAGFCAFHLYSWYKVNRYCGQCGSLLEHSKSERALVCSKCGNIIYPKIAPAVIVGVTDGDKIVVTRYKDRPYRGLALIAGFCEFGETPEQTAVREVFEETGLKIKDLEYFGSQPWGMDSNLLIGYFAKIDGDRTIKMDESELSEALWVNREQLESQGSTISLTKTMINHFKKNA